MTEALYIGLLSGTSRDGADAVLATIGEKRIAVVAARGQAYPADLATDLSALVALGHAPTTDQTRALDERLGAFFADCAHALIRDAGCEAGDITAIGSHGQTVWHAPRAQPPVSVQLGSPAAIARRTGIVTVGDFRRADLEAGGEGAPLAPLLHARLFTEPRERRAVLNLGGIANVTLLEEGQAVRGYDTGPGNCLLDAWAQRHLGQPCDLDGHWAATGSACRELARALAEDPYFTEAPPKSTGVEHFNIDWLDARLAGSGLKPADVQATLALFTASTVADALGRHGALPDRVLVCGGGVHNPGLVTELSVALAPAKVESTAAHGVDPDWIEGLLFAWLARQRLAGRALHTGPITGARTEVLLGTVHEPEQPGGPS